MLEIMKSRIIRLVKILSNNRWNYFICQFEMGGVYYDGISLTDDGEDYFIFIGDVEDIEANIEWKHCDEMTKWEESYLVNLLEKIMIES